jgi:hypothetical protein
MANLIVITYKDTPRTGSLKERVKKELAMKGALHIFNETDFEAHKRYMRKLGASMAHSYASFEIANRMIFEHAYINPTAYAEMEENLNE